MITGTRICKIVAYSSLIERLRAAYGEFSHYTIPTTARHAIGSHEENTEQPSLLIMPAWGNTPSCPYLLVKSVTVFPANGSKGLPSIAGMYVLSSLDTGKQLAVMDGTELILWRTACTSALAADYLARKDSKVMLMVGAGALAPHLIQAHLTIRPSIKTVLVWNRTHSTAVKLVEQLNEVLLSARSALGRDIVAVTDLQSAVRNADIISCATLSTEPLIAGSWLSKGAHLDLVGSFTPSMREVDDECIKRCRIVVDTMHAVEASGDLVQPLKEKVIEADHIVGTLAELVHGLSPELVQDLRREDDEITLFKSVGCTVGDLAAAQMVYESLKS